MIELSPAPPDLPQPQRPKPRITVVEQCYYQTPEGEATGTEARFSRSLESEEQPFVRKTRVGEEWKPFDTAWLKPEDVGMLVIENRAPSYAVRPTPEERAKAARKVVLLGVAVGNVNPLIFAQIPPGESLRLSPREFSRWAIRCESGFTQVNITALPK